MVDGWDRFWRIQHSSCSKQEHKNKERSERQKRNCPRGTETMQGTSPSGTGCAGRVSSTSSSMDWRWERQGRATKAQHTGHLQASRDNGLSHREPQSPSGKGRANRMIVSEPGSDKFCLTLSNWTTEWACKKYLIRKRLWSSLLQVEKRFEVQKIKLHKPGGGWEPTEEYQPGEIPPVALNRLEMQMERRCEHVATWSLCSFTLL